MSIELHVGNISGTVTAEELKVTFGRFGPVETVVIATDAVTGLSKGFATVAMAHEDHAVAAIGRLNFSQYDGRTIGVSRSRKPVPGTEARP